MKASPLLAARPEGIGAAGLDRLGQPPDLVGDLSQLHPEGNAPGLQRIAHGPENLDGLVGI